MTGADRIAIDTHPYFAFDGANTNPIASYVNAPCSRWGAAINTTQQTFGVITAGEWSVAINDCGLFVNGVGVSPVYGGAEGCDPWNNWETWDQTTKNDLLHFGLATMDALQNWFFWTWKIGPSAVDNAIRAPFWSYQLGLQQGWLPTDPRDSEGACASLGEPPSNIFSGTFQPWQTGGAGAGQFEPAATATFVWPPTSLNLDYPVAEYLPTYTPTGTYTTLPVPLITAHGVNAGNGWYDSQDQAALMVPITSCSYPDAYGGALLPQPTVPFCDNTVTYAIPTPVPVITVDTAGNIITTTLLETNGVVPPGVVIATTTSAATTSATTTATTATATTTTVARRFAPRAGIPLATLMA